jgi:hypothetical protein
MSKKVRRKNEVENETYDILQLDEKIKRHIQEETKRVNLYKERVEQIGNELSSGEIPYRTRKQHEEELETFQKKIYEIETNNLFSEYICMSQKIIGDYMKLVGTPMSISFFGGNKSQTPQNPQTHEKKEDLLQKFLDIAKNYIPIKTFKREVQRKHSCLCGNSTYFTQTENTITCDSCGIEKNIYTIHTNFKDVDRVNLSQKYKYNKKTHFRDTMNQYQGKQNKKIDPIVYEKCDQWFKRHNLLLDVEEDVVGEKERFYRQHKKITKGHIDMALCETGNTSNYEDVNLIHNYFTGIPCPDISHIESELNDDFDKVAEAYETLKDVDRTNFLNSQYVLYQLLRRRKEKVDEGDFHKLKTRERLIEHDSIYSKICLINEWSFSGVC